MFFYKKTIALKNIVFLVFFFFLLGCKKDISPKQNTSKQDTATIPFLLQRANDYSLTKYQRMRYIALAENQLSALTTNDTVIREYYLKLAGRYYNIDDFNNYFRITKRLYRLAQDANDTLYVAKSFHYMADYYYAKYHNDSAYYYFTKAEKKYLSYGNVKDLMRVKFSKADILLYEKDFSGAETEIIRVLKMAKKVKDYRLIYDCYANLGNALLGLNNDTDALKYYEKALEVTNHLENDSQYVILKPQILNYIGNLYAKIGVYQKAKQYYKASMRNVNLKFVEPYLYSRTINSEAYTEMKLGNFEQAEKKFFEALAIRESQHNVPGIVKTYLNMGELYKANGAKDKAVYYLNKAMTLGKVNKIFEDELKALEFLTEFDLPDKAKLFKRYIKLNDSLQTIERANRNKFARIAYETEEILNEKNTILKQRDHIALQRWLILGGSLIVIVGFVFFFYRYLQSQKRLFDKERRAYEEYMSIKKIELSSRSSTDSTLIIQEEVVKGILQKLEVFEKERRFLDKNCSLDSVAKEMDTNTTYLSKVINEKKGCNFSNYINGLRIDYGIYLLENDLVFRKYSISGMAESLGFNSTTSFTRAFTAKTNMRPSFFLSQLG